jgi:hypothetical protein
VRQSWGSTWCRRRVEARLARMAAVRSRRPHPAIPYTTLPYFRPSLPGQRHGVLLISQRRQGVYPGGAPRRNVVSEQRDS